MIVVTVVAANAAVKAPPLTVAALLAGRLSHADVACTNLAPFRSRGGGRLTASDFLMSSRVIAQKTQARSMPSASV